MRVTFTKTLILLTILFACVYVPMLGAEAPNRYIDFVGTYEKTVHVGKQSAYLVEVDHVNGSFNLPNITDRKIHVLDKRFSKQCEKSEAATVNVPLPGDEVHVTGPVTIVGGLMKLEVACGPAQFVAEKNGFDSEAVDSVWDAIRANWLARDGTSEKVTDDQNSKKGSRVSAAQAGIANPVKFRGTVTQTRVPCPPTAICEPRARIEVEQVISGAINARIVDVIIPPAKCSGGEAQVGGLSQGNRVEVYGGLRNQGYSHVTVDASCAPAYIRNVGSFSGGGGYEDPTADFSWNPDQPQVDEPVYFQSNSSAPSGRITDWFWDMGDGGQRSGQGPVYRYRSPGSYSVCLRVRDNNDGSDRTCQTVRVEAEPNQPPTARFNWRPTDPQVGETVNFQDQSTDDERIESWHWEFGDGAQSSQQNPSHRYSSGRNFEVCLTVTDNAGASDIECLSVNVSPEPNAPPNADFNWSPVNPIVNEPAEYTDQSTDSDGRIVSWNWEFPSGSTSSERNPTHQFDSTGTFRVCLTVRDNDGASDSTCEAVLVINPNRGPNADFTWTPRNPPTGETVNFQDQSSDPDGRIVSHSWDFGGSGTSQRENPSHTFTSAATYSVCLTVEDEDGLTDEECQYVRVESEPTEAPDAQIEATPRSGQVPLSVEFSATGSSDPDGRITGHEWNFGDGNSASGETVSHTYQSTGSYTVQLTVRDNDNRTDTARTTIEVTGSSSGDAFCTVKSISAPDSAKVGDSGNLSATIVNTGDSDGRCSYQFWLTSSEPTVNDWPRQCTSNCRRLNPDESFSPQVTYTFEEATEYTFIVTAAVESQNGEVVQENESTKQKNITVTGTSTQNQTPKADFTWSPDNPSREEEIEFTDKSRDPDGEITTRLWGFNDGPTVWNQQVVTHAYSEPGEYRVCLTVADNQDAQDTECKTVDIQDSGASTTQVKARFIYSPDAPIEGEDVEFYDMSTPKDQVVSWDWEFDNGSSSSERHPLQTFEQAGTYDVCLEVTTEDNRSDRVCNEVPIGKTKNPAQVIATRMWVKNVQALRDNYLKYKDDQVASESLTSNTSNLIVNERKDIEGIDGLKDFISDAIDWVCRGTFAALNSNYGMAVCDVLQAPFDATALNQAANAAIRDAMVDIADLVNGNALCTLGRSEAVNRGLNRLKMYLKDEADAWARNDMEAVKRTLAKEYIEIQDITLYAQEMTRNQAEKLGELNQILDGNLFDKLTSEYRNLNAASVGSFMYDAFSRWRKAAKEAGISADYVHRNYDVPSKGDHRYSDYGVCYPDSEEEETSTTQQADMNLQVKRIISHNAGMVLSVSMNGQSAAHVEINIYNLSGNLVDSQTANGDRLYIETASRNEERLANGVYLYRVTAEGPQGQIMSSDIRKLVVLR